MQEFVWVNNGQHREFTESHPDAREVVFLTQREGYSGLWQGFYIEVEDDE